MENVRDIVLFLLRVSPLTIYQFAVGGVLFTRKRVFILFLLGLIVVAFVNDALKMMIQEPRPSGDGIIHGTKTGCSSIPKCGHVSHSYGMPSGHAQIAGYTATFWTSYLLTKDEPHALAHSVIIFIFATLVSWSRVDLHCHNVAQVVTGSFVGILIGLLQVWSLRQN